MGACDDTVAPWLAPTRALIADAVARGVPTLGVCLGHQLAAVALGGTVERNPTGRTIGPVPVHLTGAAASDPLLAGFDGLPAIHYNDDVVLEPPAGATVSRDTARRAAAGAGVRPAAWACSSTPRPPRGLRRVVALDSPDGLTPEQVALLAEVIAAREVLRAAWQPLAQRFATIVTAGCRGAACVARHLLSPALPHRRSIEVAGPAPRGRPSHDGDDAMSASTSAQSRARVVILGAAGRDFHDFNVVFRDDPDARGRRLHRDADPRHRRAAATRRSSRARCIRTASRSSPSPSSTT